MYVTAGKQENFEEEICIKQVKNLMVPTQLYYQFVVDGKAEPSILF